MSKRLTLILVFTLFALSNLAAQWPQNPDFSIMATITTENNPAKITVSWQQNVLHKGYMVYRKLIENPNFVQVATLNEGVTSYEDLDVEIGKAYEYQIVADGKMDEATALAKFYASGYIYGGIEVESNDYYGKVLLLIDNTLEEPLGEEIARLINDMESDGWAVVPRYVNRTEAYDGAAVKEIKDIVFEEYEKDPENLNTVFLLGRIAVAYSGTMTVPPDGHSKGSGDHHGAWPADLYYGHLSKSYWTDFGTLINEKRPLNNNEAGDGKFDQYSIGMNDVKLSVGRVDLYNMPLFHLEEWTDPEIELYRRYLDKNHNYRTANIQAEKRGLIDDNFKPSAGFQETFASTGWRNIGSFYGAENVTEIDYFTNLAIDSYMWTYATGPGSFTSCGGVGKTDNFTNQEIKTVFTILFGSFFGDWDAKNSFLRAPLCSEPNALTSCWAARPHWYFHHMSMGLPIGYSTLISQNNNNTYVPNILFTNAYPNGVIYAVGMRQTHTALMGDPTLRLNMGEVSQPKNLSAVQTGDDVKLTWEVPDDDGIYFYEVFRAKSEDNNWVKMNDKRLASPNFTHISDYQGDVKYLVRSLKLTETNAGSYYNHSSGIIFEMSVTTGADTESEFAFSVYPNPSVDNCNISLELNSNMNVRLSIFDTKGDLVKEFADAFLISGSHRFNWSLTDGNGRRVPAGVYYIELINGTDRIIKKLIVL